MTHALIDTKGTNTHTQIVSLSHLQTHTHTHTLYSDRRRAAFYGFRTLGRDPDQKAIAIISVGVRPRFHCVTGTHFWSALFWCDSFSVFTTKYFSLCVTWPLGDGSSGCTHVCPHAESSSTFGVRWYSGCVLVWHCGCFCSAAVHSASVVIQW